MDKEAQEKIGAVLQRVIFPEELVITEEVKGHPRYFIAKRRAKDLTDRIVEALLELGYRKLPKDKPPLLSDKQANHAVTDAEMAQCCGWDEVRRARQREADIKFYEGK